MLNKPIFSIRFLAALVTAASLASCANIPGDQDHGEHHPGQSASTMAEGSSGTSPSQGGMMGGGMAGSQSGCGMMGGATPGNQAGCGMMGDSQAGSQTGSAGGTQRMNKEDMCAMYRNMRDAPNEQARQAMMDRNMQGMSPEMRQRHMEMMRQQCQ